MESHSDASAAGGQPARYRVLIVDDHPVVRRGVAALLGQQPDLEVCGEAADVDDALKALAATRPDLVLVDLTLHSGHGIDLIEQIRARNDGTKMLVASAHDETLFAGRALRAGAMGYIGKHEAAENLLQAVYQVLRGEIYLSPRMSARLLHQVVSGFTIHDDPLSRLTNRELEVFEMIGQGHTVDTIARKLQLSPKTIETHREKIKSKLELENGTELRRRAVQWVLERV